jgi:hypothetical protein
VRGRTPQIGGGPPNRARVLPGAHEAYLQGLHPDEFPGMPLRPSAPENVIVVDGTLADHDFSAPGPRPTRPPPAS